MTVNALHPASLSVVEEGAEAVERLAISPNLEGVTDRYFDGQREARTDPQAYGPEARKKLWDLSMDLAGLK